MPEGLSKSSAVHPVVCVNNHTRKTTAKQKKKKVMYVTFYVRFMLQGNRCSFTCFYRFQPQLDLV